MILTRKTTGFPSVDKVTDDIYRLLKKVEAGVSSGSDPGVYIITPLGGIAMRVTNVAGYKLQTGYLVQMSATANRSVILAPQGTYFNVAGVVYTDIANGEEGYVVTTGPCDVYFNSNGATAGDYFRISLTTDTANNDNGKAHSASGSGSIPEDRFDLVRFLGFVQDTITGEGLARCVKK
ncbi:MAG: hypothetical protein KJN62_02475 [Deltaproteobacteria bacterium]|nr:hypothetical protein [Deltaproteobacteria bacterium]